MALIRKLYSVHNWFNCPCIQTVEDDDEDVFEVDVEEFEVARSLLYIKQHTF